MATKSFADRLSALSKEAEGHIQRFMKNKDEFRFVTEEEQDESDFDNTSSIAFHGKHGLVDFAHVIRLFRSTESANQIWVEGEAYENGATLSMQLSEADYEGAIYIADLCK